MQHSMARTLAPDSEPRRSRAPRRSRDDGARERVVTAILRSAQRIRWTRLPVATILNVSLSMMLTELLPSARR